MNTAVRADSDILVDLRQGTARLHASLESRLSDLTSPALERDRYKQILRYMLAFYRPVEAVLFAVPGLDKAIDELECRRKSALLEQDLSQLGDIEPVPQLPSSLLPDIGNVASALGALYVFEGATLGGQVISRHLQEQLGLDRTCGAAFFVAYGDRAAQLWRSTQRALVRAASDPGAAALIMDGAYAVFASMDAWVERLSADDVSGSSVSSRSGSRFTQVT